MKKKNQKPNHTQKMKPPKITMGNFAHLLPKLTGLL